MPLDIFPTSVIASAVVQKSYSVNYPGEFGGGVINLTTTSRPDEPFLTIGAGVSGDTETTGKLGYTYYGSEHRLARLRQWRPRDRRRASAQRFAATSVIGEGSNFSRAQSRRSPPSLTNSRTSVLQRNRDIPANFGVRSVGRHDFRLRRRASSALIASAGFSNSWQHPRCHAADAGRRPASAPTSRRSRTDNRVVANGLLGLAAEDRRPRDPLDQPADPRHAQDRLGSRPATTCRSAIPVPGGPAQQINQRTAWFERQLIESQLVGEFDFGDLDLDLRGGYANIAAQRALRAQLQLRLQRRRSATT